MRHDVPQRGAYVVQLIAHTVIKACRYDNNVHYNPHTMNDLPALNWNADGLIPAIVQQHDTGEVLMVAWMNEQSLAKTLETNQTWFWSRSRKELWNKGATSGNTQRVTEVRFDCDADTLLVLVDAAGPACHTGERSCFFRVLGRDEVEPV